MACREMRRGVRGSTGARRARLVAGLVCAVLLGCVHHHHHGATHEPGPPPWAPAHGYRHHHPHGVDLVFDGDLGAYVVVGYHDHFYHGSHYYRRHDGGWQVSVKIGGPWSVIAVDRLPEGLRKVSRGKHKSKVKRGDSRHPAKYGH